MTNTIRPGVVTSLRIQGEVQARAETREPVTLGGQRTSDDRARQVFGDGMQGRTRGVNQGDLPGVGRVFIAPDKGTKSPLGRSQSTRRSEEAG